MTEAWIEAMKEGMDTYLTSLWEVLSEKEPMW
jgi:hypothetical protein